MTEKENISSPLENSSYTNKSLEVHGSRIRYRDEGEGDPILLLHGNPTSSYLWRNIIPYLVGQGRCIAPDLIGMGASDKPALSYHFTDHYHYLEAFVHKLGLKHIILVVHDWGSALGFYYAMKNPGNIKGMAFMESIVRPWRWGDLPFWYRLGFWGLRQPVIGEAMIYGLNAFLNVIMPRLVVRKLTQQEKGFYKAPFRRALHRKPMLSWPRQIPINGRPRQMKHIVDQYSQYLQQSSIPKLLLYAKPGGIINGGALQWCMSHINNLEARYIGRGLHFIQEDHPHAIGQALAQWINRTPLSGG